MHPYIVFLVLYLLMNILLIVSPFLAKKSIQFGIAIPEPHQADESLGALKKGYMRWSALLTLIGIALFFSISPWKGETQFASALISAIVFALIAHGALYFAYYSKTKKLKASKGWQTQFPSATKVAVDMSFHKQKKTYSNLWFLIHLGIIAGTAIYLIAIYDRIPSVMATHFDFQGHADGFSKKSFASVFDLSIFQLLLLGIIVFTNWMTEMSKQQNDPSNPKQSLANNIKFRKITSLFLMVLSFIITAFFSLLKLSSVLEAGSDFIGTSSFVFLILLFGTIILFIGMALRAKQSSFSAETTIAPMDDDRYWKLGSIYYNKKDPALFVEKRHGIGYTINMGRPIGWVIFFFPFVIIALIIWLAAAAG
ncbi:DUF1648 domain-containing protein [Paenibacillus sp. NEAU-GSW1]|uniref:DUF1648 domain-containing protein n=1 Tax=Paenibacillus sp. NEAU-GSW1 TaxID=2682486 RepID=UPI0012E2CD97|nr:DUF5808 domain-containing protein [Paenibacillus sp. NEAU-GSW1]MUT68627.1 DUF1648 domain-containing protein [Paenibacillus sp. NEAU-GSW1]